MFSELTPGSPFWQPNGMVVLERADASCGATENAARGYREVKTPILYDVGALQDLRPLGRVPGEHVLHGGGGPDDGPEADELPGAHPALQGRSAAPTATCRSATPRPASCTATSRAARCTGCCASATSPRTTPTSSAPRSRSPTRSTAASTSATRSTTRSGSSRGWSSPRGREKRIGTEEMWDRAEAALQCALDQRGVEYELNEGDGAFYGPEDRPAHDRLDRPLLAARHRAARLRDARALRPAPTRAPTTPTTGPVMIHRALMGSFERFMGILIEHYAGEFPLWLAPAPGARAAVADRHNDYAARGRGGARRGRAARASSTTAASRSGARSARRSCARCPTCSSSATARPRQRAAALRRHREGDLGTMPLDEIAARLAAEAAERRAAP